MVGAILLAGGALTVTLGRTDAVGSLFEQVLTIPIIVAILAWNVLAWWIRRLIVGRVNDLRLSSTTALWIGTRMSLMIAGITVLIAGLIAMAFGLEIAAALIRAMVLLAFAAAFTGIVGGAWFNSVLAVRHWRAHRVE